MAEILSPATLVFLMYVSRMTIIGRYIEVHGYDGDGDNDGGDGEDDDVKE